MEPGYLIFPAFSTYINNHFAEKTVSYLCTRLPTKADSQMAEGNISLSLESDGVLLSTAVRWWLPIGTFSLSEILIFSENIQGIITICRGFSWFSWLNSQAFGYLHISSFNSAPIATSSQCKAALKHRLTSCVSCSWMYVSVFFPARMVRLPTAPG